MAIAAGPMLNFGRYTAFADRGVEISAKAADLVFGTTVVDMLGLLTLDWPRLLKWQKTPRAFAESDFRTLEKSGINIFHPAVETSSHDAVRGALTWINGWNRLLSRRVCFLERVDSTSDLSHIPVTGKLGVVIGLQNGNHFQRVSDVGRFFADGQRVSQLTYNSSNALGSGCYERYDRGLTSLGERIVKEMNEVGMAVDISHCGERTSLDAILTSTRPVLITHSNCRAIVPQQPRCKSDNVIRATASKGGVMGITIVRAFVGSHSPTITDLLDHYVHVAKLVGVEHLGIGSDVDVNAIDPSNGKRASLYVIRGLDPVARIFQIADGLLARGFAARDVRLVLGDNFRRVLGEIWPSDASSPRDDQTRRDPFCPAPLHALPGR